MHDRLRSTRVICGRDEVEAPPSSPTDERRSKSMQANRRVDTKPELRLRRALHNRGYRYRKDLPLVLANGIRVRPDVVFTARKVAIFVDGCFWHSCQYHCRTPATNREYWVTKLRRNVERDRAVTEALRHNGWQVVRIWEHETLDAALAAVIAVVSKGLDRNTRG